MIKQFAIGMIVLLGSATVSFAGEVAKKVNVGTYVNVPISTGAKLGGVISDTARPKPTGPGGSDALAQPRIDSNINTRVRPKPKGPGGTEALIQINPINQVQH